MIYCAVLCTGGMILSLQAFSQKCGMRKGGAVGGALCAIACKTQYITFVSIIAYPTF